MTPATRFVRSFACGIFFTTCLTAATSGLLAPVVVVYPFTLNGQADPEAGSRLSILFADRLASDGGIVVKPAIPGTKRGDFLTSARGQGADYYVSGYLTPLGDEVSVVEQVVSASSGIVVWSNTVDLATYADAASQGDAMHEAVLAHAGRSFSSLNAPPKAPAQTDEATKHGTKRSLGEIFHRHRANGASPQPSATPT